MLNHDHLRVESRLIYKEGSHLWSTESALSAIKSRFSRSNSSERAWGEFIHRGVPCEANLARPSLKCLFSEPLLVESSTGSGNETSMYWLKHLKI